MVNELSPCCCECLYCCPNPLSSTYNELFIIDTCQGASMYERFYSPNIMALASSQVGEDSLSHQPDLAIGVHLMDRYTFYMLEFLEDIHPASKTNMNDLFKVCPKSQCVSTPGHRTDLS
uniref:GPI-anchor transamidase-like n=1 Tax=Maylandia zebra TaxID=106582 RepID=UPI000D2FD031|nr:GPI-anchor transamidase-like [Maylandia zebra]